MAELKGVQSMIFNSNNPENIDKQYRTIKRAIQDIRDNKWEMIRKDILSDKTSGSRLKSFTGKKRRKKIDFSSAETFNGERKISGDIELEKEGEDAGIYIRYDIPLVIAAMLMEDMEVLKYLCKEYDYRLFGDVISSNKKYLVDSAYDIVIKRLAGTLMPQASPFITSGYCESILQVSREILISYILWNIKEDTQFCFELMLALEDEYRKETECKQIYRCCIQDSIQMLVYEDYKSLAVEKLKNYMPQLYEGIVKNVIEERNVTYDMMRDSFIANMAVTRKVQEG